MPYVFDAYAAKPHGIPYIAGQISEDFNRAPDEFAQWDYLQRLTPTIKKKIEECKSAKVWGIAFGASLGRYNFDKMAFPSGITKDTYLPIRGSSYSVDFADVDELAFLPIAIENARKFAIPLRGSRDIIVEAEGTIASAANSRVSLKVTKITLKLKDGTPIVTKQL
jgi:hypothetical protein